MGMESITGYSIINAESLDDAEKIALRNQGAPIDTREDATRTGRLDVGRVDQDSQQAGELDSFGAVLWEDVGLVGSRLANLVWR